ncbi:MAG: beta-propeller domain-containing protein [Propionibacteriaceae bacterium]|jgi:uncharacterized secreted protein with C-terminal beta-propeller domain|nr:beta-propeller domain-containing protein [Propionibacteriaceae bacterium]
MTTNQGAFRPKAAISVTALVCAAVVVAAGVAQYRQSLERAAQFSAAKVVKAATATSGVAFQADSVSEYADVIASLKAALERNGCRPSNYCRVADYSWSGFGYPLTASAPMAASAGTDAAASGQSGYTGTNVQVAGIDEGDVVKTDGKRIFIASGNTVSIVAADAAATDEIARIEMSEVVARPDGKVVLESPVIELMASGDTLLVFTHELVPDDTDSVGASGSQYVYFNVQQTRVSLFDVSQPDQPRFIKSLGQSGAYQTSRLTDGVLYLATSYVPFRDGWTEFDDPADFVPAVYDGESASVLPDSHIQVFSQGSSGSYSVVTSLDVAARTRLDSIAVLGCGADNFYMGESNFYLAGSDSQADEDAEVISARQLAAAGLDDTSGYVTHLVRVSMDAGWLRIAAQETIPGRLVDQFAMDEYEGHLRVGVQVEGSHDGDWRTVAALYVLDDSLGVVGSVPELVSGETVESVRFDGPVGYVVTYRQVDPLFAIDLADPAQPKVVGELKIPGFSTYLHPFGDGLLLGLGVDADDSGTQDGLKLSMFDVSNPLKLAQKDAAHLDAQSAKALSDHRAVFVDVKRGLVGFQTTSLFEREDADEGIRYEIVAKFSLYRHDDAGFHLLKALDASDPDARGVRIGEYFYLCESERVSAYAMSDLAKVADVSLA